MKKSRHSEEKIIASVKQLEGGRKTADVARELGVSQQTLYVWKPKRQHAGEQRQAASANWRGAPASQAPGWGPHPGQRSDKGNNCKNLELISDGRTCVQD